MEGVADDLTLQQREELAAAIYEYRDVISSGPTDMGRTGLVKHTIDTGDQRPIQLPPRRMLGKLRGPCHQEGWDHTLLCGLQKI